MLPDGSGAEVLREIRDRMLSVPVAVVSGAGEHMLEEVAELYPEVILRKPIDIADLLKWVREQGAREDRKTA
jgi:DNA-binding response OmpR family regulator